MSKIHPQHLSTPSQTQLVCDQPSICYGHPLSISSSTLSSSSIQGEIFTIWMKSLILGGKGCTVFDSKGQVVYRVDNYSSKCCDQVYLMDSHGHVLLTILRKVRITKGYFCHFIYFLRFNLFAICQSATNKVNILLEYIINIF